MCILHVLITVTIKIQSHNHAPHAAFSFLRTKLLSNEKGYLENWIKFSKHCSDSEQIGGGLIVLENLNLLKIFNFLY